VEEQSKYPEKFAKIASSQIKENPEEIKPQKEQGSELVASYEQQYGRLSLDQACSLANMLVRLDCE